MTTHNSTVHEAFSTEIASGQIEIITLEGLDQFDLKRDEGHYVVRKPGSENGFLVYGCSRSTAGSIRAIRGNRTFTSVCSCCINPRDNMAYYSYSVAEVCHKAGIKHIYFRKSDWMYEAFKFFDIAVHENDWRAPCEEVEIWP